MSEICPSPLRKGKPIQFILLCGEPLGNSPTRFSSSNLASQLDVLINGGTRIPLSLAAVPALIPKDFSRAEVNAIRKLISRVDAHREIFGGPNQESARRECLIDNVDTILTSIGSSATALAFGDDEFVKTAGITREDLQKLVIGDIGGVLFPRPHLGAGEQAALDQIVARWTGITEKHIKYCIDRARHDKTPGVIVVAIGESKATIVYECVKRGLVNHLVIDQDLAKKLESVVDTDETSGS